MKTIKEKRKEIIEEICLLAKRIKVEKDVEETIFINGIDFEKKVVACAKRISELTEKLKEL